MTKTTKIILIILAIFLIYVTISSENKDKKDESENVDKIQTLNIDPNYFADSEIWGGSMGENKWNSATIREGYRSRPTTNISLSEEKYDQEIIDLPLIKSDKEIYVMEDNIGAETFDEQIKKYGDLAKRFLPDDLVVSSDKFDVDKDGIEEQIIGVCGFGGNGCPHITYIVKNNKIIFSTGAREIIKTDNGNGFTLVWQKTYKDPYGEMRTRFVFEDEKFKPVYEQEIEYFRTEKITP